MTESLKIEILDISDAPKKILTERFPRSKKINSELANYVKTIIDEVKKRGDAALVDFAMRFDNVKTSTISLRVNREEIEKAYEKANEEQISAIEFAKNRVETLERDLLKRINFEYKYEDMKVQRCTRPIRSVGCYVPGGEAAYPSTLIMTIVPAKVAGVSRVVVCSPPRSGGEINPLTLVAADICGANEIFKVGGAQAIAALAYGTETIKSVEKIVGPGNKFVMMAKILVSQDVPIDMPAGPSEILILADDSADPRLIALDMISQAEHGVDCASILATTSRTVAEATAKELNGIVKSLPNKETVVRALKQNGLVLVCKDMEAAVNFVNEFAPEHLEVMAENAEENAERIMSSGVILLGKYTPVSASDYCLGTNHVLPTGGFSRVFSGLSVFDFVKRTNIVECSEECLLKIRRNVKVLAENEGLMNHALAVEGRFKVE